MEERGRDGRLDPEFVAQAYQAMRDELVEKYEREHTEPADRREEWLARRPAARNEELLAHLERQGVGREERRRLYEERDRLLQAQGDAYREYFRVLESETQPRAAVRLVHPPGPADLRLLAPDAAMAMPYAILGLASDRQMLSEDFLAEEIHNPYAQKMDLNIRRPLWTNLWGSGSGLHPGTFFPEYNTVQWADVFWVHIYDPHWNPAPPPNWSYYAHLWLRGAFSCWAEDGASTSLFAGVAMWTKVTAFPIANYGSPQKFASDPPSELWVNTFSKGGQNINWYWNDLWKFVYKLTPHPWHRDLAQFVIVQFHAQSTVRGLAHAMTNFSKGGELPVPFGTYCLGVKIL